MSVFLTGQRMAMNRKIEKQIILRGLALLCFVLLFVGGPGPDSIRIFRYGWGLGHLFSFALWTYLYLRWRSRLPVWRQALEVLLLALLLGGVTELIQAGIGREATWQDLANDLLGSLLGLVFAASVNEQISRKLLWLIRIPVLALVCWTLLPFVKISIDDLIAWQQFPLLSGFETPLEQERWGGNSRRAVEHQHVYSGASALRVELNTQRYSGLALRHFPADWSQYRLLRFRLFNPEPENFEFYFRIHDRDHAKNGYRYSDRYNTSLVALPGWSEMEISLETVARAPRGRSMDLTRIAGMNLFVVKLEQPRTIYIDAVELVQ